MEKELYRRLTGWHVLVTEIRSGKWEAFAQMVPVAGHAGSPGDGELVPGGPFPTRDDAGDTGVAYVEAKVRQK